MVLGVLGGFDELVDDVLGRRHVRVAHAEIDDVLAPGACLRLQIVDDREDVRRQALDPVELLHRATPSECFAIIPKRRGECQRIEPRRELTRRHRRVVPGQFSDVVTSCVSGCLGDGSK